MLDREEIADPPAHLKAEGKQLWPSVFANSGWLWKGVDRYLVELTADLIDEQQELRELTNQQPDNTRLRAALRQLDKQLVSNLGTLGFTPSDRSRLGLVQVKTRTKHQELWEQKHKQPTRSENQSRTLVKSANQDPNRCNV